MIPKPKVPGCDVSGRVIAVGEDVSRFSVGDDVYGMVGEKRKASTLLAS